MSELTGSSKLAAYVSDYLDDNLNESEKNELQNIIEQENLSSWVDDYAISRGQLQIALQKVHANEKLLLKLNSLLETDATRISNEEKIIDKIEEVEHTRSNLKLGFLFTLVAVIVSLSWYYFGPEKDLQFNALESLIYEGIALDESPETRLDFATNSISEVNSYLRQSPDINYSLPNFKPISDGWELNGVSVIDYEVVKIIALNYSDKSNDTFTLFVFPGDLKDLPKAEPGNEYGLLYQAYAGDEYTLIAWQYKPELLAFIVGRDSPQDFAKIASRLKN